MVGAIVLSVAVVALAQQEKKVVRIGLLAFSFADESRNIRPFREELKKLGYIEGTTAKLPIEFAGYVNPGPARTPIIEFADTTIERAKKKAEGWKALCARYRLLVEAEGSKVKAAS